MQSKLILLQSVFNHNNLCKIIVILLRNVFISVISGNLSSLSLSLNGGQTTNWIYFGRECKHDVDNEYIHTRVYNSETAIHHLS